MKKVTANSENHSIPFNGSLKDIIKSDYRKSIPLLLLIYMCFSSSFLQAQAPSFTSTPTTTIGVNNVYNYPITTTDPNGDKVTVTGSTLPSWITLASTVSTLAGSGAIGSTDGTGTAASFHTPSDIVFDAGGDMYISGFNSNKIRKITTAGVVTTFAGSGTAGHIDDIGTAAQFNGPTGLAIDPSGNIYVAELRGMRIRKITPAGVVTTIAGSGATGSLDGNGIAAEFNLPFGITIDPAGNLYVTERYAIRKITPAGVVSTIAGSGTAGSADGIGTAAEFNITSAIDIDASGNLYMCDYGNHKIRKITSTGVVSTFAGSGVAGNSNGTGIAAQFSSPKGLTIGPDGNIYVSQDGGGLIRKITTAGVVSTIAGTGTSGFTDGFTTVAQFNVPDGMAFDFSGDLFIVDNANQRIRKISQPYALIGNTIGHVGTHNIVLNASDGNGGSVDQSFSITVTNAAPTFTSTPITSIDEGTTYLYTAEITDLDEDPITLTTPTLPSWLSFIGESVTTVATAGLNAIEGMTVDNEGNIYTAHQHFSSPYVIKITPTGVVTNIGIPYAAEGFFFPTDVAADAIGNIYVANSGTIKKISVAGMITTFAGSGTSGFADGTGSAAQFNFPRGVAVDAADNVYVADQSNHKIRKITAAGVVTTLAGSTQGYADGTGGAAQFNNPVGVAVDVAGNVYVSDQGNHKIRKITAAGAVTTFAGSTVGFADGAGSAAQFNTPFGLTIDATGNLYVIDDINGQLRKITPAGVVTTYLGVNAGFGDGTGIAAQFPNAKGVTVDTNGNLYVNDQSNGAIVKIITHSQLTGNSAGQVGTHSVVLRVTDANSASTDQSFSITVANIPTITSASATSISADAATLNGEVTSDQSATITERGFVYALSSNDPTPTLAEVNGSTVIKQVVSGTTGAFNDIVTGLISHNNYSYIAFATNSVGSSESSVQTFTTLNNPPTFTSTEITTIGVNNDYNYSITTNDIDVDIVSITAPTLPSWLSLKYNASTQAGSGSVGNNNANGASASFSNPYDAAVDAAGNLYVADHGNHLIRKITPNGDVSTLAGSGSNGNTDANGVSASFYHPVGVAVDAAGNVYVADLSNHRIRKITTNGDVTTLAGSSVGSTDANGASASFNNPTGIAVDASGNVYVADQFNHKIRKIAPNGDVTTLAGSGSSGSNNANGVSASFNFPSGVAVDASGNVYVADRNNYKIRKISPNGDVTTLAGSGSFGSTDANGLSASFSSPSRIALDASGNLYITDLSSHKIRKINPNGDVTTLTGTGSSGSTEGLNASFNGPRGLALDASRNLLYVVDASNHKIRKLSLAPFLTGNTTGQVGSHNVVLNANDGQGGSVNQSFSFTVTNAAPTFTSTAITSIDENASYEYIYTTNDTDGDDVTVSAPTLPAWMSISIESVSTLAGPSDGSASTTTFNSPNGVAVDASGNAYIADRNNNMIKKVTPAGVVTTLAGSGVAGFSNATGSSAQFNSPAGMTIDANGNVYVADFANSRIRKITSEGVVTDIAYQTSMAGAPDPITGLPMMMFINNFQSPTGVAINASGDIFVTDAGKHQIIKITGGTSAAQFAGAGTTGFVNATGTAATFNAPADIAIDASGNLYVADQGNHSIRKVTSAGVVTTLAGSGAAGFADGAGTAAQFNNPTGIVVDTNGNVFVADQGNYRIRKITPTGVVTTIVGADTQGFVDGVGASAKFHSPVGVSIDAHNFLYVTDLGNQNVRKISPVLKGNTTGQVGNHSVVLRATDTNSATTDQSFTITVNDITKPTLSTLSPIDNAASVNLNNDLVITLSESIQKGTGNILIKDALDDAIIQSIDVTSGLVTISGAVATINPSDLLAGKNYYVQIPSGVLQDVAGNNYDGINDKTTWNFITTTTPSFTSTEVIAINDHVPYSYTINTKFTNIVNATTKPSWLTFQQQIQVSTLAGSSTGANNGIGTAAQFSSPNDVAVDKSGNVYVADGSNHLIRKITPAGVVTTLAGSTSGSNNGTGTTAQFNFPFGIAVDGSGNVYVADYGNHRIRKITSLGVVTTLAGSTSGSANGTGIAAQFNSPSGVAVDDSGNVYVADAGNHLIRKITPAGVVTTLAGSTLGAANGTGASAQFDSPIDVAVDAAGNVYVAGTTNNLIRKITPAGVVTTLAGSTQGFTDAIGTAAQFDLPIKVDVDFFGNVYVMDGANNRIRKVTPAGVVTTVAGSTSGTADGSGATAQFNSAQGLAVDDDGNIYLADTGNHRIRKVTQSYLLSGNPIGQAGTHAVSLQAANGIGATVNQSFNITVTDILAPTITTLAPANNAISIALNTDLVMTFSETIQKGNGSILIKDAADDATIQTIDVTSGLVTISGTVVTVNPSNLLAGKNYYVQITSGAIKDAANNDYLGITDKTSWSFATKLETTFTFVDFSKTYGDANFDLAASTNSTGTITYSISGLANGTVLSGTNNKTVQLGNAGTVTIVASSLETATHLAGSKTITMTINKKTLTVTANSGLSKTYGSSDPTLTYTITGFKGVDNEASLDTQVTISRAAGENVADYVVTPASAADANYSINFVTSTFAITTKTITVTADANQTKVYGAADPTFTYSLSGTLETGDAFTGALARTAGENVGTFAINIGTLSAGANYNVTFVADNFIITAKAITITADANQTKVYGAADPTFTYSLSGGLETGDAFTGALTRTAGENVGTFAINIGTLSAGANYNVTFVTDNFSITAKAITVTADANQTKVYGAVDPTFTYSLSGALETGDAFTGALARTAGENVGTFAINIGTLSAGANYNVTFVADNFSITAKAITITADANQTKEYGAVDPTFTYSLSGTLETGDAFTGAIARTAGENVGTFAINIGTLSAGANYNVTFVADNFSITTKAITITTDPNQTKVYGAADPTFTYSLSGALETGDAFTGALARTAGENVGTFAINIGTLSAGANYNVTFVTDNFSITAKAITVTANANQTKVYGGADPTLTYSLSGALETGDAFTGALARTAGENVGTFAINIGTLSAGANYNITFVADNFSITAKTITITADANQTKEYGAADPTFTYSLSGALETGDAFTGALARTAGENVGTFAINIGTLSAGANYNVTFVADNFSITTKAITITTDPNQTKVYGAADPTFTYSLSGALETGDAFTGALARTAGENVGTFAINIGTLSAGANYNVTFVADNFSITAKSLTITADANQTKEYGAADPTFTYSLSGALENGDAFTGALARTAGENVGTFAINIGTLSAGANYNVTFVADNFSITKAMLTATAEDKSREYGTANPAFTITYTGFKNSEASTVIDTTPTISTTATTTTNVGTAAITLAGGSDTNYDFTLVNGTLTIGKATVTATADNQSRLFGAANPTLTISYTGFKNNETETVLDTQPTATTTADINTAVGTAAITLTGGTDNNYDLTLVNGILTITNSSKITSTITFENINKVYGDIDFDLAATTNSTGTISYSIVGDANGSSLTGATLNIGNAGSVTIEASVAETNNFTAATKSVTLTIAKVTLTATAENKSREFGTANPALTIMYTGFQNNDTETVIDITPTASTTADINTPVGDVAITLTGGSDNNYELTLVNGILTITNNKTTATIAFEDFSKVYGDVDFDLTATTNSTGTINYSIIGEANGSSLSGETLNLGNAGSLTIEANVEENDNFTAVTKSITLTIEKAKLTATAEDKSREFGEENPEFTITYAGFLNDDTEEEIDVEPTASSVGDETTAVGTAEITLTGGSDNNYNFDLVNGTLTITKITSIGGFSNEELVYPNPAYNFITIESLIGHKTTYLMYSQKGMVIYKGIIELGNTTLDVSDLNNGLYLLKLISEQQTTTAKIVIHR